MKYILLLFLAVLFGCGDKEPCKQDKTVYLKNGEIIKACNVWKYEGYISVDIDDERNVNYPWIDVIKTEQ